MTHSIDHYSAMTPNILGSSITSNGTELATRNTRPTFNGSVPGEKSGIVVIWIDDVKYTAPIQPDGRYSFTPPVPLDEGLHNISIHAIKLSGLIGEPTLFTLHVDTTAPDAPLIEFALDDAGSSTGARLSDEKTDDRNPLVRGNAEPGSIVKIYEGSALLGSVKAGTDGSWALEVSLSDGSHALTATATDKLGNTSAKSASFVIEIGDDSAVPEPLPGGAALITHAVDNAGSNTDTLTSGGLTDDTTPELHGTAPAGSTVRIQYRNEAGAWTDGGNALMNGSDWSWTPPTLGTGQWEFRANAGSGWSDEFLLEISFTPSDEARITHAYDDFGTDTGTLTSGAITDDRQPTLHGRGESNSVVYLHYRNTQGTWEVLDSVDVGADGRWRYDTDRLVTGSYEFQVSNTLTRDPEGEPFALKIVAAGSYVPTIDYAWDNAGDVIGKVLHNEKTDDTTPTLNGTAEANSIVNIEFWRSGEPVNTGYSVKTDSSGHWEWTPPTILTFDTWNFKVYNLAASPSAVYSLEITPPVVAESYFWDFQDITYQGWRLAGEYAKDPNLIIFREGDNYYMGSQTERPGKNYKGDFIYRDIEVKAGVTYEVSFKAYRKNTGGVAAKLGFSIDGNLVIDYHNIVNTSPSKWHVFTGTYVATETKTVKIAIVNNESAEDGNDFRVDDIGVKVVSSKNNNPNEVAGIIHDEQGVLDISDMDDSTKVKLLSQLLAENNNNLFISHELNQVMIKGDSHASLSLQDIHPEGNPDTPWVQQPGMVTIAGIIYHVYRNGEAELLVQDGVNVVIPDTDTDATPVDEDVTTSPPEIASFGILGSTITSNGTELWTKNTQPTFNGSVPGEKSGIVVIWIDNDKYTAAIQPDGSYSFALTQPLDEGLHNISIHAIKISGLVGEPVLFTLHIDTTAPDVPAIELALDDAGSNTGARLSGEKTDDRRPVLRGDAEPGSIVKIYEGSVLLGSVKAATNGSWALEVSLSDGSHALTATATDKLGNTSKNSASFVIDIGDDVLPMPGGSAHITHAVDNAGSYTGPVTNGGLTDDATPELHGTAPAGSTVRIQYRNGTGAWIDGGNALLNGGDWSWTPPALGEGKWEFRANAGGGWSDEFLLEIDFTPGSEASITHAYDDFGTDTGILTSGAITDDRTPTLHGRGESNGVVYLHYRNVQGDWEVLDSVNVGADGRWRYETDRLVTGSYEFQVSQTLTRDPNGEPFALKIVAEGSYVPTIDYAWDDAGNLIGQVLNDGRTDDTRPALSGSAESNSLVIIEYFKQGDSTIYSATARADGAGKWQWTPEFSLSNDLLIEEKWQFTVHKSGTLKLSEAFNLTIAQDSVRYIEDFNDQTARTFSTSSPTQHLKYFSIDMYNKGRGTYSSGIGVKFHDSSTAPSPSLLLGKTGFTITLNDNLQAKNIKFTMGDINKWAASDFEVIRIYYYDKDGVQIDSSYISGSAQTGKFNFSQNMPDNKFWHSIKIYHDGSTRTGQWVWIDNFEFEANRYNTPNIDAKSINSLDIAMDVLSIDDSHKMVLDADTINFSEKKGSFIDNDSVQLMIKGETGDVLTVNNSSFNNSQDEWILQSGTITIAGIQYHILKSGHKELLIQDGITINPLESGSEDSDNKKINSVVESSLLDITSNFTNSGENDISAMNKDLTVGSLERLPQSDLLNNLIQEPLNPILARGEHALLLPNDDSSVVPIEEILGDSHTLESWIQEVAKCGSKGICFNVNHPENSSEEVILQYDIKYDL